MPGEGASDPVRKRRMFHGILTRSMDALSMALRATPTNFGPGKLRCRWQTCRNLSISILPSVPRTSSLFSIGLAFQDSSSRPCASPALIEALHSSNCSDGLAPVDEHETSSPETSPAKASIVYRPCTPRRSEEHTSELQSLMRISYAVFCLKKK